MDSPIPNYVPMKITQGAQMSGFQLLKRTAGSRLLWRRLLAAATTPKLLYRSRQTAGISGASPLVVRFGLECRRGRSPGNDACTETLLRTQAERLPATHGESVENHT
ncbi:hypothetical protein SKAU_G00394320 [Synaphobranchus kaupii]|uniref:Uncharacterized protein n=1 Tax=Synaphobranchus kaupii TaxID=118154 RepID=A0A9Q1IDX6_SYNKA|nr:hypothetical protein SKAU_G00394320 [Synaphobranchus kaupii]